MKLPKSDLAYWKPGEKVWYRGEVRVVAEHYSYPFVMLKREDGASQPVSGEELRRVK